MNIMTELSNRSLCRTPNFGPSYRPFQRSARFRTQCRPTRLETQASGVRLLGQLGSIIAAFQIALLPIAGASLAELDTATEQKGLGATIEGSDISNEDQKTVLAKLKETILPEAKRMLGKVGKGEGSNYPSSIAKELETVDLEVNDLIAKANKGGDMSNIKSAASGIEQQINALKAIVGFD